MTNEEKLQHMLEMQDEFNKQVHPQWREQNYPFHLAIIDECAEALNHYGWKWWAAKKEPDIPMVKLEMVDIWCFLMSDSICKSDILDLKHCVTKFCVLKPKNRTSLDFKNSIALLYDYNPSFSHRPFFRCLSAINMDFDELYRLYIGKMALNKLRQDRGYKEGKYIKVWCFKGTDYMEIEDNLYMYNLCDSLKYSTQNYTFSAVYEGLDKTYQMIKERNQQNVFTKGAVSPAS